MRNILSVSTPGPNLRPTRQQVAASVNKTIPDIIAPGLKVLFCGINPGLYSAAVGHHFARPGNRFWPALHAAGFTPRLLSPFEAKTLLELGYGLTNMISRATAGAQDLNRSEFAPGARVLGRKIKRYRPRFLAVLGLGAYRLAFAEPKAELGLQSKMIHQTRLWILPNPSGLNAHYQVKDLAKVFAQLRKAAEKP